MRRKEQDVTSPEIVEELLSNVLVCRLGMCLGDKPYVVPLNFAHKGTTVFIHGCCKGKKIDILRENPMVFFEATREGNLLPASGSEDMCKSDFSFQCLMARGVVEFVEDAEEKAEVLDVLCVKYYGKNGKMSDTAIHGTCVLKIKLEDISVKQSGVWP